MNKVLRSIIYGTLIIIFAFVVTVVLSRSAEPSQTVTTIGKDPAGKENVSFDDVLSRLSKDEESILQHENSPSGNHGALVREEKAVAEKLPSIPAAPLPLPATVANIQPESPKPSSDAALQQIVEQKRVLEAQQEKLIDQIISYRRDLRDLRSQASQTPPRPAGNPSQELARAQQEAGELEQKYLAAKRQLDQAGDISSERDQMRTKVFQLQDRVAQLELEIEQKKSLEKNNGFLRAELEQVQKESITVEELTATNERMKNHLANSEQELATLSKKSSEQEQTIHELEKKSKDAEAAKSALLSKLNAQAGVTAKQDETVIDLKRQLSKTIDDTKMCQTKLSSAEAQIGKVSEMEREVVEAKNALMLKDVEIRSLSSGKPAAKASPLHAVSRVSPADTETTPSRAKLADPVVASSDVVIAEVVAEKANLRSGPGLDNASLMQVQRGTHLVVETRKGNWLRVITPQGSRAYVMDDVVQVLNEKSPPSASVKRIDGDDVYVPFDNSDPSKTENGDVVDDVVRAFEKLKSGVNTGKKPIAQ